MLERLRLKTFKSFVDEEVELAPLTLLVGANGSGKSNLIDAIRFLQGIALDLTFDEVLASSLRRGVTVWPGIRGGAKEITYDGAHSFQIQSSWVTRSPFTAIDGGANAEEPTQLSHVIACEVNEGVHLSAESVSTGSDRLVHTDGKTLTIEEEAQIPLRTSSRSVLGQIGSSSSHASRLSFQLEHTMRDVAFLELRPEAMRGWGNVNAPFGTEGENFAGRLADFANDDSARRTVVEWIRELCAPEIESLDFIRNDELGEVMLVVVEKGGKRVSARSISDGTLRFLGLFVALYAIDPGQVVVLEEIDTGLHPARLRVLVELLEQATRERGVQVIATTHSPTLLQWLSADRLRDVIAFGRVSGHEGTIMRRLGDIERFSDVVKHEQIGELFSTGWLEMAL